MQIQKIIWIFFLAETTWFFFKFTKVGSCILYNKLLYDYDLPTYFSIKILVRQNYSFVVIDVLMEFYSFIFLLFYQHFRKTIF